MPSIGDVLNDRYQLVRLLGRGGMSDVYEALDERSGVAVALKIVRSGDPEFTRRLAQEARALERFVHPGLITLLDTGFVADQTYLVMEMVDGPNLAETLRRAPLVPSASAELGARLASALAYVHERGVVHRDVKPSNILLGPDGQAWLGDFGIARLHDASTLTATGTTMGTVSYMAPEQLEDHDVGPAADIWSLGMVLLECLTGRRVYQGTPSEVMARRLAGPVPLPSDLPVAWKLLLSGMLDHRSDQRLDGSQVAALLATAAFDAEWSPVDGDATVLLNPVAPYDLTALMPGVAASLAPSGDATMVAASAKRSRARIAPRLNPLWGATGAVAAAIVALLFTFWPSSAAPPNSTTTTSTAVTTTTQASPKAVALAKLMSDVASGEGASTVDNASGQHISQQAQAAITDEEALNANQAANDLQQAATTIAQGVQSGTTGVGEGSTLQRDLTALATALGLEAPSVPPTGPPSKGHGHGKHK